ncbi:methyltransferase domain-containing protein [bacterium]|nr:methyltransferase domain-containing protein [bacterium]
MPEENNASTPVQATAIPNVASNAEILAPENTPAANQAQVYGKSELLDAGKILTEILEIKTGQVVADLGVGGGFFTLQAARLVGEQGQVYAVDIMKEILNDIESQARMAGLYNIKTIWSNLEMVGAAKIPEETLHLAMLNNILFQSQKHYEMLTEASRLIMPSGRLLIIDWSDTGPGFTPDAKMQVDPNKIISQAQELGLILEQKFQAGKYHFGLIFSKP